MTLGTGNLQAAHRGYVYQDLFSAYFLVRSIFEDYQHVIVDRKEVQDDRIDDLEVLSSGRKVRRQFKSSENPDRALQLQDFVNTTSSLRIDRLVLSFVRTGTQAADEYRLCVTWEKPVEGDELRSFLEPIETVSTLDGYRTELFKFRAEAIWPETSAPLWAPLTYFSVPGAEFDRQAFLNFSNRFVIELCLPKASMDLTNPGPLETKLIHDLAERVGIGKYPNHGRNPVDVAAVAVRLATNARSACALLTPTEVEHQLQIRTDFGRIPQAFPFDAKLFWDRPTFRNALLASTKLGGVHLVTAPPGSGKSWELTQMSSELSIAGAIVARHYCYLEPGDELVNRRVTKDVLFGNLLSELIGAEPSLRSASYSRYSAGLDELESVIKKAAELNRQVVLIVDGLDHIARVRAAAEALSDDETGIIRLLATLELPTNVALVLGSQPGVHLDPLREAWGAALQERIVPRWTANELLGLVETHALKPVLIESGFGIPEVETIVSKLANRADGNPLYGRYLIRSLAQGSSSGDIPNPSAWLDNVPTAGNDISLYYAHLYNLAGNQAKAIADLLGVIEFAATEIELREILGPLVGNWVPRELRTLAPILSESKGQGGIRVFHESFRRFMNEELTRQGRSVADALAPAITWLRFQDFFSNAKSYRFLLSALSRAGRGQELLELVNHKFVSESVAQAHPKSAIQNNISIAADTASRSRNWPALVRCVELNRSLQTCFDESQNISHTYFQGYLDIFGPDALAARLIFDGKPTQSKEIGLFACHLIDDAGGTAPWSEYFELSGEVSEGESYGESDPDAPLTESETSILAVVHGKLRLGRGQRLLRRFVEHILISDEPPRLRFVSAVAARFTRMTGPSAMEKLANRGRRGNLAISAEISAALRVGIAEEFRRQGRQTEATAFATAALEEVETAVLAATCFELGAFQQSAIPEAANVQAIPLGLERDQFLHTAAPVRAWISTIKLLSFSEAWAQVKADELLRFQGIGWYRCWLRYVLEISETFVAVQRGEGGNIQLAFQELSRDVRAFAGHPRPSDLYRVQGLIYETVAYGLSLLRTDADWDIALKALKSVALGTSSRLDREDGGPLPDGVLLDLLLPHATNPVASPFVASLVEDIFASSSHSGTYYSNHAEQAVLLSRVRNRTGQREMAIAAWNDASVYMTAYGFHKDVTIFDIIECIPSLSASDLQEGIRAVSALQPLVSAVIRHTDQRETRHAPNVWLETLIEVNSVAAAEVLARTLSERDDTGWPARRALKEICEFLRDKANPVLIDALLATFEVKADHTSVVPGNVDLRLSALLRVLTQDRQKSQNMLDRVVAEAEGDGHRYRNMELTEIVSKAVEVGLDVPPPPSTVEQKDDGTLSGSLRKAGKSVDPFYTPAFPPNASPAALLRGLRIHSKTLRWDDDGGWTDIVHSLSYHLGNLLEDGKVEEVDRLLYFFARDIEINASSDIHPLGHLAESLENAGYLKAAALAYALSYGKVFGGFGYLRASNKRNIELLNSAIRLNPATAKAVVAEELAHAFRGRWLVIGTTQQLIERLVAWGEPTVAWQAWREAYAVLSHRLPLTIPNIWFARFDPASIPDWNLDESLIALILARLEEASLWKKVLALQGLTQAIEEIPQLVSKPLRWWITKNASTSSVLLVLQILFEAERAPYVVSRPLIDLLHLLAKSGLWGVQLYAAQLLLRLNEPAPILEAGNPEGDQLAGKPPLTDRETATFLAPGINCGVRVAGRLWSDLVPRTAHRTKLIFESTPTHLERGRERFIKSCGRKGNAFPPMPILSWETELFLVAFHQELTGLRLELWNRGRWTETIEQQLLSEISPYLALHLSYSSSRTMRPNSALPSNLQDGMDPIAPLENAVDAKTSWCRLATMETQHQRIHAKRYEPPDRTVHVIAGAVAISPGGAIPQGASPLTPRNPADWWNENENVAFPPWLPQGPIVGYANVDDWLGDINLLIPPCELLQYIGLTVSKYGDALLWRDSEGKPAVQFRSWRILDTELSDVESVVLEGCDLIARTDVFNRIQELCGTQLQEYRIVHTEDR